MANTLLIQISPQSLNFSYLEFIIETYYVHLRYYKNHNKIFRNHLNLVHDYYKQLSGIVP